MGAADRALDAKVDHHQGPCTRVRKDSFPGTILKAGNSAETKALYDCMLSHSSTSVKRKKKNKVMPMAHTYGMGRVI
jgi:hypothetical protein